MRIWSLHPQYLDAKGLVALWRETLLAKHVLEGKTKGYKNHPQLNRFKEQNSPVDAINQYLEGVYKEAVSRGYRFNENKFNSKYKPINMKVTRGQMAFEVQHLLKKLKMRDVAKHNEFAKVKKVRVHPMFKVTNGVIEDWEIV